MTLMAREQGFEPPDNPDDVPFGSDERLPARIAEAMRARDATWIIGTSLLFEAVVLALATLVFVRRDF
jgi:hypothetical protein